jgi:hypothetical protein
MPAGRARAITAWAGNADALGIPLGQVQDWVRAVQSSRLHRGHVGNMWPNCY